MSTSLGCVLYGGVVSPVHLGSVLIPCTVRYLPASLVYIIDSEGHWLHKKLGIGIIILCIVKHR